MVQKTTAKTKILVVEDDPAIVFGIKKNLEFEGFDVVAASDGELGLQSAIDERPDLIILDIMLPGVNGYEICETLRKNGIETPVIFLSAKAQEADRILGLETGGDDYVTKPFSVRELLARVRSVLRRVKEDPESPFRFGQIVVDWAGQTVSLRGKDVNVTAKEFELLRFLIRSRGNVMPRETILKKVWGFNYYGTSRTIDNFINRLRQKIEDDLEKPRYIRTIRGVGYKFDV